MRRSASFSGTKFDPNATITAFGLTLSIKSSSLGVKPFKALCSVPSALWRQNPQLVWFPFSHQLGELPQLATVVTPASGNDFSISDVRVCPNTPTECESPTKSMFCCPCCAFFGVFLISSAKEREEVATRNTDDSDNRAISETETFTIESTFWVTFAKQCVFCRRSCRTGSRRRCAGSDKGFPAGCQAPTPAFMRRRTGFSALQETNFSPWLVDNCSHLY